MQNVEPGEQVAWLMRVTRGMPWSGPSPWEASPMWGRDRSTEEGETHPAGAKGGGASHVSGLRMVCIQRRRLALAGQILGHPPIGSQPLCRPVGCHEAVPP